MKKLYQIPYRKTTRTEAIKGMLNIKEKQKAKEKNMSIYSA